MKMCDLLSAFAFDRLHIRFLKNIDMRSRLLVILAVLLSFSVTAQDFRYSYVMSAFSAKELPSSKAVKTYQAIDGQIYGIGDKLELGVPQDNSARFSYIDATSEYSRAIVEIKQFVVIKIKNRELGSVGSIGAVVMCEQQSLFISSIDLAITKLEIVGKSNSESTTRSYVVEANALSTVEQKNEARVKESKQPKAVKAPKEPKQIAPIEIQPRKGYGGIVSAELGSPLGVSIINGYHLSNNWYIGGGVGLSYFTGVNVSAICVPVFAYGQYTFTIPRKIWPYVALGVGASVSSVSGAYVNISGGIAIKMKKDKQHFKIGLSIPIDFVNGVGGGLQIGYSF